MAIDLNGMYVPAIDPGATVLGSGAMGEIAVGSVKWYPYTGMPCALNEVDIARRGAWKIQSPTEVDDNQRAFKKSERPGERVLTYCGTTLVLTTQPESIVTSTER